MQGIRTVLMLSFLLISVVGAGLWFGLRDPARPGDTGGGGSGHVAPAPEEVEPPAPVEPGLAVSGHGRGSISGRMERFKTGEAVPDVVVRLFAPPGAGEAGADPLMVEISNAEGWFEFADVPAGSGYEVWIDHGEFAPVRRPGVVVLNGEVTDLGTLYLEIAVEVKVRVTDGGSAPIAGAKVELFPDPVRRRGYGQGSYAGWVLSSLKAPAPVAEAETGEDGVAVLAGIPTGWYVVSAVAGGFGRAGARKLLSPDTASEEIVLRLPRGYRLEGAVTDSEGGKVEGLVQVARANYGGWQGGQSLRWASPIDEEGEYALVGLPPGAASITVIPASGTPYPAGTISVPDVSRFDISIGESAALRGEVSDEEGHGIAGAEVRLVMSSVQWGGSTGAAAVTDADGAYRIDGLPKGRIGYLEVLAEGYARYPPPGTVDSQFNFTPGEEYRKDVTLSRGATLSGKVTAGQDDVPVSGAAVTILPRSSWGSRGETVTTDLAGSYRFAALGPGEYAVQILAEGFLQPEFPTNSWRVSRPGQELDDRWKVRIENGVTEATRDFHLEPGAAVSGTVVDSESKPVGGATVYMPGNPSARPVQTKKDGTFEFAGLSPRTNAMVYAYVPGRSARSDRFTVPDSGRVDGIRLILKSPGVITGIVEMADGGPPPGGTVRVVSGDVRSQPWMLNSGGGVSVPIGADGSFRVEEAPTGKATVIATVPGQPSGMSDVITLPEGGEVNGVMIRLDEGSSFDGEVVDSDGAGVEGARITVYSNDPSAGFTYRGVVAISGSDGGFTVSGVLSGKYTITAIAGERGMGSLTNFDPTSGAPVRIEIAGGGAIEGSVVDRRGAGIAGMLVQASLMSSGNRRPSGGNQATTGVDGTFRLTGLKEEAYRISAMSGWTGDLNYARGTKENVRPGDPPIEIRVEAGLKISGQVYGIDGQPLFGQVVRAYAEGENRYDMAAIDGSFDIVGLAPGAYTVSAGDSGGKGATVTIPDVSAGTTGLVIRIQEAQEISGRAFGPDGAPAQSVQVRAEPMPGTHGSQGYGRTNGNGEFRIARLAPGSYRLTLQSPGKFAERIVNDVASGSTGLSIALEVGLSISGSAVGPSGEPAAGVTLMAKAVEGGVVINTNTDGEGKFTFGGLAEGEYTISVTRSSRGLILEGTVTVKTGKEDLKLQLKPGLVLRGRVVDRNGRGLDGAWVSVANMSRSGARTANGGNFEMKGLPPGKITLRVWAMGTNLTKEVETTAGSVEIRIQ